MSDALVPAWPREEVTLPRDARHGVRRFRLSVRHAPPAAGDAEPAVLLHGLGGASTNWTDVMAALRDRIDAVAPDLPGFGWSPPPDDGDYSPDGHARAVRHLVEDLADRHAGPVHLAGNSLGGAVALRLAATRPGLVRSLTLVSPALPDLRPRAATVGFPVVTTPLLGPWLQRRLLTMDPQRRVRQVLRLCYADPSSVPPQRLAEAAEEVRRRALLPHAVDAGVASLRGLLGDYVRGGPGGVWALARQVRCPVLLVYGSRDRLVPVRHAPRAGAAFGDSRVVVLPRSGHVSQMEHPGLVADAMRALFDAAAADGRDGRRPVVARAG